MRLSKNDLGVIVLALSMIAGAVLLALVTGPNSNAKSDEKAQTSFPTRVDSTKSNQTRTYETPKHPVLYRLKGSLMLGGLPNGDREPLPFVIGETITLNVEAINVREYRWTCNGVVLHDNEMEWSENPLRLYEFKQAGGYSFSIEGRGPILNESGQITQEIMVTPPLIKELQVEPVKLLGLELDAFDAIDEDNHRRITGHLLHLSANYVLPNKDMAYLFRYTINGQAIPDREGREWTPDDELIYPLEEPGTYTLKLELRREIVPEAEARWERKEALIVADAIVEWFDFTPDHQANLGQIVELFVAGDSIDGTGQARFGVKNLSRHEANFTWVKRQDGSDWGEAQLDWKPTITGDYMVRIEVRNKEAGPFCDAVETLYVINP